MRQEPSKCKWLHSKFLKIEVDENSASLVPILKWSWNESTIYLHMIKNLVIVMDEHDSSTPNKDC